MKIILLSISIILAYAGSALGIPTLNQGNTAPDIGDMQILYPADTSINEGPSGPSQTWVFNGLAISTSNPASSVGVTVASTPYAVNFPNANVALQSASAYEYINSSSTVLRQLGTGSGSQIVNYTPGIDFIPFPFTYGTTANLSSFTGTHAQGTLSGTSLTTGDAHGSITINGQTVADVVRVKIVQDITYDYTGIGQLIYHTIYYIWYDGIHKTPVLETATADITGFTSGHVRQVIVGSFVTGVGEVSAAKLNIDVFPNPSHSEANISFSLLKASDVIVKVYDYSGAEVMTKDLGHVSPAIKTETLDLSGLAKGIYMLEIIADDQRGTRRVIVE